MKTLLWISLILFLLSLSGEGCKGFDDCKRFSLNLFYLTHFDMYRIRQAGSLTFVISDKYSQMIYLLHSYAPLLNSSLSIDEGCRLDKLQFYCLFCCDMHLA